MLTAWSELRIGLTNNDQSLLTDEHLRKH